jgi:3-deoxy-D-manno-octulosonic-acid transferase
MAPVSLWLYRALLRLGLPLVVPWLLLRDRLTGKRRPRFADRMARRLPELSAGGVWVQAVSVGEVELTRRLLRELAARRPQLPVLLTATTASGLELARRTAGDSVQVLPCPLDLPAPVGRVLDAAQPRLVVLVETELWPELLHQAGRRRVPVAVVNGRLSDASAARYRRIRGPLAPLLEPLSLVLVRGRADADRFAALGVPEERIVVAGNIKYDLEPDPTPLPWAGRLTELAAGRPVVVAGSTMEGEEAVVLDALAAAARRVGPLLTVLAPRHPERFAAVARLLEERGQAFGRRSALADAPDRCEVLLLDTIGELARAYRHAHLAFIGGSLVATGGHNPLEPAVWAVPVLSGPHVFNFREVYHELVAAGGVRLVADGPELEGAITDWLANPEAARHAGLAGRAVIEANRGATARTVEALLALVDRGGP